MYQPPSDYRQSREPHNLAPAIQQHTTGGYGSTTDAATPQSIRRARSPNQPTDYNRQSRPYSSDLTRNGANEYTNHRRPDDRQRSGDRQPQLLTTTTDNRPRETQSQERTLRDGRQNGGNRHSYHPDEQRRSDLSPR